MVSINLRRNFGDVLQRLRVHGLNNIMKEVPVLGVD
jgi:hypothetical protein